MIARVLLTAVCALIAGAIVERANVDAAQPKAAAAVQIPSPVGR